MKSISILGTRGIPARHGGFETFAEHLAKHLVAKGWLVTVYCQSGGHSAVSIDSWEGIRRVTIRVRLAGPLGTIAFDWRCVKHAVIERPGVILTLGYNTAVFDLLLRRAGLINIINMDGVEWMRDKWSLPERLWLRCNERAACRLGNHLIADHPHIASHLSQIAPPSKITMIPYGADFVAPQPQADWPVLQRFGLTPKSYALLIARPEPENSLLEIVSAFSRRPRDCRLVVLGKLEPRSNQYHSRVMSAASHEVMFVGAIYDQAIVSCLRANTRLYVHGHRVGGTNPSLVEAMGAGCAIFAHDNAFNRWVAGDAAAFFGNEADCEATLNTLLCDEPRLSEMRAYSRTRHQQHFTWPKILDAYERLLAKWAVVR
jgi:glycosyltransferase involved in cell wall biosynthesis